MSAADGQTVFPASLRRYVLVELVTLALLTPLFLLFAPHTNVVFLSAALGFLLYIAFDAKRHGKLIWPPQQERPHPVRSSLLAVAYFTIPTALVFLAIAIIEGRDYTNPNLLGALVLYFLWALIQQTIFQYYLLGRLRVLLPEVLPIKLAVITGTCYGLVHLPLMQLTLLTVVAGIIWSSIYLRFRRIWPLALSHAILGSTYYYWVTGRDMIQELSATFAS